MRTKASEGILFASGVRTFYREKVLKPPGIGKVWPKARVSVVRRNLKKVGFWELKVSQWANLWPDEQKSHIRPEAKVSLHNKSSSVYS